jgi:hypothetical protein
LDVSAVHCYPRSEDIGLGGKCIDSGRHSVVRPFWVVRIVPDRPTGMSRIPHPIQSPALVCLAAVQGPISFSVCLRIGKGLYVDVETALAACHLRMIENLQLGVSEGIDIIEYDFAVGDIDHAGNWPQIIVADDSGIDVAGGVTVAEGLEGAAGHKGDLNNNLGGFSAVEISSVGVGGIDGEVVP